MYIYIFFFYSHHIGPIGIHLNSLRSLTTKHSVHNCCMLLSYLFHHTGVHLTTKPCVKALIIQYNLCFGEEMRDRDRHF